MRSSWCGQDIDQYKDYSDSMLAGKGFSANAVVNMYYIDPRIGKLYVPEILRLPGYPVLLSAMRFFIDSPIIILWSNALFYGFSLLYTSKLVDSKLSVKASILLILLTALNPTLLFYTFILPSVDVFAAFCLVGFVFHLSKAAIRRGHTGHIIFATVLSVFGLFTRQNLLPVFIGVYLYVLVLSKQAVNKKHIFVSLLISITVLSAWSYRNYLLTGKYTLSSLSGAQLFGEHIYFTPYPNADSTRLYKMEITNGGFKMKMADYMRSGFPVTQSYSKLDSYAQNITFSHIRSNPQKLLHELPLAYKLFITGSSFGKSNINAVAYLQEVFGFLNKVIMYLFPISLLYGLIFKFRARTVFIGILLALFIFISVFYHGSVVANRGLIPVWPLLAMYFSCVAAEFVGIISKARRSPATRPTSLE